MTISALKIDTSEPGRRVADYTVGFLLLRADSGGEDAHAAGSGILVSLDKVFGVLTAAHVLSALPDHGKVGLVVFPRAERRQQRLHIEMQYSERISIGKPPWSESGPDIGFLRLAPDTVDALQMSNTFRNLSKASAKFEVKENWENQYFDAVAGVIAESTTVLPPRMPNTLLKEFQARFQGGKTSLLPDYKGFDRCAFVPDDEGDLPLPTSFEGASGGGLWRIYWSQDSEGKVVFPEVRLAGVAYYQSQLSGGSRTITCHGPRTIYRHVIKAIQEHWTN